MRDMFERIFRSKGINYMVDDKPLNEMLNFVEYDASRDGKDSLTSLSTQDMEQLGEMGQYVSNELIEIMDYVDHKGKPELITWGLDGTRIDYVRLSPEHRKALQNLQNLGSVSRSVSGDSSWMYHFVSGYLISDPGIFCTLTLTAQTAYGLRKYLKEYPQFLQHYLDSKAPWYGATFYSETQGGSDLAATKTTAVLSEGKWSLNGQDKYFASNAGIADGAIVTAKIGEGGIRSIGTFFVPYINENAEHNFLIRRLKNKLGTIAVPSGEVELSGSEAYLLGQREFGIYYAMEILTISRVDDALAAIGIARKAFWEAYIHTERRKAFGKYLLDLPLMRRDLLTMESEIEAALVVSLYSAMLFSHVTDVEPPYNEDYHYARFMTHLAKNAAAWMSDSITSYSMEIFGGIGFFEEFPVAKFHRDALVTSIWEGTSNIQSLEMLETISNKGILPRFLNDMKNRLNRISDEYLKNAITEQLHHVELFSEALRLSEYPQESSKNWLKRLVEVPSTILLAEAAAYTKDRTGDDNMMHIANIYYFITYGQFLDEAEQVRKEKELFSDITPLHWMSRNVSE